MAKAKRVESKSPSAKDRHAPAHRVAVVVTSLMMSNFQRTRSKVWWGDSPPNVGSPIANKWREEKKEDQEWEPQLPHWIDQPNKVIQQNPPPWPLRHGSPGSHKSQDSGFSDSDSSPPPSQYYQNNDKSVNSSSSSDSNNNENVTVKRVDFPDTPQSKDTVDSGKTSDENNSVTPTPKGRLRSSSVIQTPYDLQKYYEVHRDQEHMELLRDKETSEENIDVQTEAKIGTMVNISESIQSAEKVKLVSSKSVNNKENYVEKSISKIQIHTNSTKKINNEKNSNMTAIEIEVEVSTKNIRNASDKYPFRKSFVSSQQSDSTKVSKVAKVKDLETSRNKSDESLEYIRLNDDNEIAVNNQPRVRSPIANVSYVPTERTTQVVKAEYKRSLSNEDNVDVTTTPKFQRNRLNKSLNFEGQRLDQQILEIQEGYSSLGYIDEDTMSNETRIHQPTKAILGKNIMDSLHLKPPKKVGPKAKQRLACKADKSKSQTCSFRIFPAKKEKPEAVGDLAGGVLEGSRVPALGLPRHKDQDQWVVVGYPEQELLIPAYNERLVATDSDTESHAKDTKESTPKMSKYRRLSPPPQFKDKPTNKGKNKEDLTHDSKREKLKKDDEFLDVQFDMGCTSTPKMLTPHEFMSHGQTPTTVTKTTRKVRLVENFNQSALNNEKVVYRERNTDHTALERACAGQPDQVQHWLCDLIGSTESECMTTLQSKPLGAEMKAMVSANSATITGNIKKVQTHGQIIVHQYSDVVKQMEENGPNEEQICLLVANINEFVLAHSITLNTKPPGENAERWDKVKSSLQIYLQKLIDIGEDIKAELNEGRPHPKTIGKHLEALVAIFLETTKAVLVQQTKTLVSIIEEPPSDMILKSTLTSIGHLATLNDETESSLHEKCQKVMKTITDLPFVDCGVPRALLTAIIESNKSSIKALSLRALATVCVTGEAVKQFEEGGGIEIISDILNDDSNPEPQMREAITVLTQITAPWLRGHYDVTQLRLYLGTVVENITGILSRTECCQLLLLCTACLVNLVRELELEKKEDELKINCDIVEVFTKYRTIEKLLDAVKRRGPSISVFLQEQTASLLASLSRIPRCVLLLSQLSAVSVALVCFCRNAPAHAPRAAEMRAQARLHCHAAEAISRLSVIPEVSQHIVQLEGVPLLTKLVRSQKSNPHLGTNPDQILIHCLKALRTIYKHQPKALEERDLDEMVRPHLMESLMLFSSKQESFV
ncbi:Protein inscuteable homolog [Eumeta japonica]|uniref:Protein inscuteable homolog n=1 Tax=Eumeta variegata TaxID=151549 RepID=A0A4C1XP84_EUMVA|nr:Protein inscuteable homolog [Eumeta japonica]